MLEAIVRKVVVVADELILEDPRERAAEGGESRSLLPIVYQDDDVRAARRWIKEEAPEGTYTILVVHEAGIKVDVVPVPSRVVSRGTQSEPSS